MINESTVPGPEFGSRPEDVLAFNEAVNSVNQHNEQFSMGRVMARTIFGHLDEARHAHELMKEGATQDEAEQVAEFVGSDRLPLTEEEQMARSIVGITNADALELTGLTLSPLRTQGVLFTSEGQQSYGEVRLQVTDGSKFSGFLLATDPKDATEEFQHNSVAVVDGLVAETTDAIMSNTSEQTAAETLVYAKGIIAGLEHIGVADSPVVDRLNNLYEHAQQGDIAEYVHADNAQLFTDPSEQAFGPAKWQRDATGEFLSSHWNSVLEIVKAAKENPKAEALYKQLVITTQASLDYAKADWATLQAAGGYASLPAYGEGFDDIFETVGLELGMIASHDEEA